MLNDAAAPESDDDVRKQVHVYNVFSTGPRGLEEWRAELRARGREEWREEKIPPGQTNCRPAQRSTSRSSEVLAGPAKCQPAQQSANRPSISAHPGAPKCARGV